MWTFEVVFETAVLFVFLFVFLDRSVKCIERVEAFLDYEFSVSGQRVSPGVLVFGGVRTLAILGCCRYLFLRLE